MSHTPARVVLVPLVPHAILPQPASAHTRAPIPAGYGVQEQCLPFTAASALGFLIPSPIRFGVCPLAEVPAGCHAFRSPIDAGASHEAEDSAVFYVADNPACRFTGNAYDFEEVPAGGGRPISIREPGISFFDRPDQQDLFKLHLPYIWRTPESVDTLFGPLLNRSPGDLDVLSGLVETDWYASPVNLVLRKPTRPVHVEPGRAIAHAILIARTLRRPPLDIAASHARATRDARKGLALWDRQHAENRSAYKVLARSRHGRADVEERGGEGHAADPDQGSE